MRRIAIASLLAAAAAFAEEGVYWSDTPVTCHWIGAVRRASTSQSDYNNGYMPMPQMDYAMWTNQNNWAEGIVPGRIARTLGDGTVVTNGSLGSTAVFDGGCTIRCIELTGMVSVSNLLVTGSTAPRFYFGHWRWTNPYPGIERGGGIYVTSDVPEAPYVIPLILFSNVTRSGQTITVRNDSPGPLDLYGFAGIDPPASSWLGGLTYRWEGTGEICRRFRSYNSGWGGKYVLAMSGGRYVVKCPYGTNADNTYYLETEDNGYVQTIEIPATHMMGIDETGAITAAGSLTICGEGTLALRKKDATPILCAKAGKTLDISVPITRNASTSAATMGFQVGNNGYTGVVRLSGTNAVTGVVSVQNGATLEVPSVGTVSEPGPVGTVGVTLVGKSFLRYTGAGETTDLALTGAG